jgi:hypothetical protein
MHLPDNLTPEAHRAIVEIFKIAARHGRERRLARERAELERQENDTPVESSRGATDIPETATDPNGLGAEEN